MSERHQASVDRLQGAERERPIAAPRRHRISNYPYRANRFVASLGRSNPPHGLEHRPGFCTEMPMAAFNGHADEHGLNRRRSRTRHRESLGAGTGNAHAVGCRYGASDQQYAAIIQRLGG